MLTPRSTLTRRCSPRSTRRRPGFRSCSADAAAAARTLLQPAPRSHRPHRRAVHRRRAHGDDARAVSARRHRARRRFRRGDGAAPAGARAAFDATLAFFGRRADRRRRTGHVPARRVPRASHVRKLPRPAARAPRARRRPGGQREPLRADEPLHGPRAAAAARPLGALRSHPYAGAHRRRHHRRPRPDHAGGRRATPHDGASTPAPHRAGARRRAARLRARGRRRARRHARAWRPWRRATPSARSRR